MDNYDHKIMATTAENTIWIANCGARFTVAPGVLNPFEFYELSWGEVNCPDCWVIGMGNPSKYADVFGAER